MGTTLDFGVDGASFALDLGVDGASSAMGVSAVDTVVIFVCCRVVVDCVLLQK
jgi:hypothetical protein